MKKISKILIAIVMVVGISLVCLLKINADPEIKEVEPGVGTLQDAIKEANDGDVFKLKAGEYSGDTIVIDKAISIEGVGNRFDNSKNFTTITSAIDIKNTTKDKKVKLSGFSSSQVPVTTDKKFINVESPVDLDIDEVVIWYIGRDFKEYDNVSLYIANGANESNINVSNSYFSANYDGISLNSSDTTVTVDNSDVSGRMALRLSEGSKNNVTIRNNSHVSGRSFMSTNEEAISIKNQEGLVLNIDNSTIEGNDPKDNEQPTVSKLFSLGDSNNVVINITGNSVIVDDNPIPGSSIFDFGASLTNTINLGKDVQVNEGNDKESKPATLVRKYNISDSYAVIGIYNKDKEAIIKPYNLNEDLKTALSEYETEEGYVFKGWYKTDTFDEPNKVEELKATKNEDLYPKFVKKITLSVGEEVFNLEEGQRISDLENKDEIKEKIEKLKEEDKNFKGYIIYGESNSQKVSSYEELENIIINENSKIEAIHNVEVKVNGNSFEIEVGKKLSDIEDQDAYKEAKLKNRSSEEFSRFVTDKGETFNEDDVINTNINLTSKFFTKVHINDETYQIEEGNSLESNEQIKTALEEIKESKVDGKSFKQFEVKGEKIELNKVINEETTIDVKYNVKVTIGENEYNIDEGSNLDSLSNEQIRKDLEQLKTDIKDQNKTFDGYVISVDKDSSNEVIEDSDGAIDEVLNYSINYDTTIYAECSVTITIGGKEFTLETGQTLRKLENNKDFQDTMVDNDREFSRFVYQKDGKSVGFGMDEEVTENMTLTPRFYVNVTISDTVYKLEEYLTLNDLSKEGMDAINALKNPENGKHFEKLQVNGEDANLDEEVTDNKTVSAIYYYNVSIVNEHGKDGVSVYKLYENESLSDSLSSEEIKIKLSALKSSIPTTKTFKGFKVVNNNGDKVISSEEEVMGEVFGCDTTIDALTTLSITINGKVYHLDEGQTLNDLNEEGKAALEELKTAPSNKTFTGFVKIIGEEESPISMEDGIYENMTIKASYDIRITIKNKASNEILGYVDLKEDGKFSDVSSNEVIFNLKSTTNKTFVKFVNEDNSEVNDSTTFNENTIIYVIYNIMVTINDVNGKKLESFELNENDSLRNHDLSEIKTDKFSRFVLDGKTISENKSLSENVVIIAMYNKNVVINDIQNKTLVTTEIEENSTLKDIASKLSSIKNTTNKRFKNFVNGDDVFSEDSIITNDITLTAKYEIDVYIDDVKYTINEGESLKDIAGYKQPENVKRYEDTTGKEVDFNNTKLYEHTNVNTIYEITIAIDGEDDLIYETGDTLNEIRETQSSQLEKLKEVPLDKNSFKQFAYINAKGEKIKIDDNTPIYGKLVPVYNVLLTIKDDVVENKTRELFGVELEEDQPLTSLEETEKTSLEEKIIETEQRLEQEGKHNYKFTKFINELDESEVDIKTTTFNKNTTLIAVYEYQAEPSKPLPKPDDEKEPDKENEDKNNNGSIVTPNDNNSNNNQNDTSSNNTNEDNNNYPLKEKVPNTKTNKPNKIYGIILYIISSIGIIFGGVKGCKAYLKNMK